MNDLGTLNAKPRRLAVAGREYLVYPLTLDDFGGLQRWVDAQFPDPLQTVADYIERRPDLPVAVQKHLYAQAVQQAGQPRPRLGTPEADTIVQSVEGAKELIYLGIRKGDPGFTRDDAARLFAAMTVAHMAILHTATNADLVLSDPKAPTPAGPATPTTGP